MAKSSNWINVGAHSLNVDRIAVVEEVGAPHKPGVLVYADGQKFRFDGNDANDLRRQLAAFGITPTPRP